MPDQSPSTQYSVLLTVYRGDDSSEFETAIESCLDQTYPPAELLVVADGPLTEDLKEVLSRYEREHAVVNRLQLPKNHGRGQAVRVGVRECQYELIGIMSADDICLPDRFERQVSYLENNPDLDVVGGYLAEFSDDPDQIDTIRTVPSEPSEIARMAQFRSPMNEVTVMFRREAVLSAGNYRSLDRMEDYDLWVRLLQDGATLGNIPAVLVKMRAGSALIDRRGGVEYAKEEVRQQLTFLRTGFIGMPRFVRNICLRVPVRLVPTRFRSYVYRRLFRREPRTTNTD